MKKLLVIAALCTSFAALGMDNKTPKTPEELIERLKHAQQNTKDLLFHTLLRKFDNNGIKVAEFTNISSMTMQDFEHITSGNYVYMPNSSYGVIDKKKKTFVDIALLALGTRNISLATDSPEGFVNK